MSTVDDYIKQYKTTAAPIKNVNNAKQMIKTLKAWKGKVYATVIGIDDAHYIQIVKSDLITYLSNHPSFPDGELELSEVKGDLYLDRGNGSE